MCLTLLAWPCQTRGQTATVASPKQPPTRQKADAAKIERFRACLHDRTGLLLSEDTIRRRLQGLGYVWKRFRYVLPPDPEREKKKRPPPAFAGLAATQRHAGGG